MKLSLFYYQNNNIDVLVKSKILEPSDGAHSLLFQIFARDLHCLGVDCTCRSTPQQGSRQHNLPSACQELAKRKWRALTSGGWFFYPSTLSSSHCLSSPGPQPLRRHGVDGSSVFKLWNTYWNPTLSIYPHHP